ncbi:hypothetical protein DFH08DRAFT_906334 [Mycena albidolilacea]|uniref:Uncharacterized protein n=1 Tax=Mycena albidolilacea TaxID=1033008 RepID=A0AAD7E7J7_9AGAR|nr:hypothetical protein DFH08DRAFT_906334 [Mycena albidolilacea]
MATRVKGGGWVLSFCVRSVLVLFLFPFPLCSRSTPCRALLWAVPHFFPASSRLSGSVISPKAPSDNKHRT